MKRRNEKAFSLDSKYKRKEVSSFHMQIREKHYLYPINNTNSTPSSSRFGSTIATVDKLHNFLSNKEVLSPIPDFYRAYNIYKPIYLQKLML